MPMQHRMLSAVAGLLCALGMDSLGAASTTCPPVPAWAQFRGPGGTGVALHADFPVHFGPNSNLLWQATVGPGHSSPCVWGNFIFLTTFDSEQLVVLCLDRATGKQRWRQTLPPNTIERGSRLSNAAASTPTTDGERLYVYFGTFGLVAFDFAGKELWRHPLPTPITQHGASSSPVLAGDLVVQLCDQDVGSYLLAVTRREGREVWRTERPGARRGFTTPLVLGDEVVVAGTLRLAAYDRRTGRERWTVRGLPNEMCASPIAGNGLIFVAGWTHGSGVARMPAFTNLLAGDADHDERLTQKEAPAGPAKQHFHYIDANKDGAIDRAEWESMAEIFSKAENVALAIRPGGEGEVTDTHVQWRFKRGLPYVPTPLRYGERLYLIKNGGLLSCLNATNGAPLYLEERVGALGDYYASPVAANGKLIVIAQNGTAVVVEAGDTLNVLARNPLGSPVMATPAIADNTLYIRTERTLFAFAAPRAP